MDNITWIIFKKHLPSLLLFFVSLNIIAIISSISLLQFHIEYINTQMTHNIMEYKEVDREQLCGIAECSKVYYINHNKLFIADNEYKLKTKMLVNKNKMIKEIVHIYNNIYTDFNSLLIYNKLSESFYYLNMQSISSSMNIIFTFFIPFTLIFFICTLFRSIKDEKEGALITQASNEVYLANKSMIMITENIHHELNTPLEVIDNKLEKIKRVISIYLTRENEIFEELKKYNKYTFVNILISKKQKNDILSSLDTDFEFITTASGQIYSILEKMKGFKHLRYSNGNKSVYDIISGAFKMISISNTNFEYKIDNSLHNYYIHKSALNNSDALSIIINHIKNSLEANASKILIILSHSLDKESHNDIFAIRIVDNGNGIPKEFQKNIFKPNFSTKSDVDGVRGNGMYLNHHIMTHSGGNIILISSSPQGTTIELIFKGFLKNDN